MTLGKYILGIDKSVNSLGAFLNQGALALSVTLAAADLVLVVLEVVSRSVGSTIVWTEELSRWCTIWMTFIGASVILREGGHIRVEYFISICPRTIKILITLLGEFAVLFFLVFLTVIGWNVAVDALRVQGDIILIPKFFPKVALAIGAGLMVIHQVHHILRHFIPDQMAEKLSLGKRE
jgi:TRAP-type C4-dicarboxylate transport system permease small subunit